MASFLNRHLIVPLLAITTGCATGQPAPDVAARHTQARQALQAAHGAAISAQPAHFRDIVLMLIALWQVEVDKLPAALSAASELDPEKGAPTVAAIAGRLATTGNHEGASRTFRLALQMADRIDSEVNRNGALEQVGKIMAESGDTRGALELAARIDDTHRNGVLHAVAVARARTGDTHGALSIATQMLRPDPESRTLLTIMYVQLEMGDTFAAVETATLITHPHSRIQALRALARASARAGDSTAAAGYLQEALRIANTLDVPAYRTSLLQSIAVVQADTGDLRAAIESALAIEHDVDQVAALIGISAAMVKAGDLRGATGIRNRAAAVAAAIPDAAERARTLHTVIAAQAEAADHASAARSTALALQAARLLQDNAQILGDTASAQARAGDIAGALNTAGSMADSWYRESAYGAIAMAQAKSGDYSGAIATATLIGTPRRASALGEIVSAQAAAGELAGARLLAAAMDDDAGRAQAWAMIAAAQARAGDATGAALSFEEALNSAVAISTDDIFLRAPLKKAAAIAVIAAERALHGDATGALAWAAAHGADPVAQISARFGTAAGLLRSGSPARRLMLGDLWPEWAKPDWARR